MTTLPTPDNLVRKSLPHIPDVQTLGASLQVRLIRVCVLFDLCLRPARSELDHPCLQVVPPPNTARQHGAGQLQPAQSAYPPTQPAPTWAGHEVFLAPLTMAQHTARRDLVDMHLASNPAPSMQQHKRLLLSPAVYSDALLRASVDRASCLPPLPDRPRPHSAEPLPRSELHMSLGAFTDASRSAAGSVLRGPKYPPETAAAHALRPPSPKDLLSEQLVCVAKPPGVVTGVDAVHFFHSHEQTRSRVGMFIYCNYARREPGAYAPYDLVAVDPDRADPEHFIVSATGVCHFAPGERGNTVTPLHTWIREEGQYAALRQLRYFRGFALAKAWLLWKVGHRRGKFQRRAEALQQHHPMLNEWFGPTTRHVASLVRAHRSLFTCLLVHVIAGLRGMLVVVPVYGQCTPFAVQCGTLKAGATGIWQRVGGAWQVASIAYSLKHIATNNHHVDGDTVRAGALHLPLRLGFVGHEGTCQTIDSFQAASADARDAVAKVHLPCTFASPASRVRRISLHPGPRDRQLSGREPAMRMLRCCCLQALELVTLEIRDELERLALDVADELHDAYPEELSRPALRDICGRRPSPRQRSRLRAQAVRKFEHLSPRERYDRACAHAEALPGALRLAHFILEEHLADLAATSLHVRARSRNV